MLRRTSSDLQLTNLIRNQDRTRFVKTYSSYNGGGHSGHPSKGAVVGSLSPRGYNGAISALASASVVIASDEKGGEGCPDTGETDHVLDPGGSGPD